MKTKSPTTPAIDSVEDAKPSDDFLARAERFRIERSKAWVEFLEISAAAGYMIRDTLGNRSLFMSGYESGRENREQYAANLLESERAEIERKAVEEFVADVEKEVESDWLKQWPKAMQTVKERINGKQ